MECMGEAVVMFMLLLSHMTSPVRPLTARTLEVTGPAMYV